MEYYFGKETYKNRGYAALRKNYQNFDSIVEFSEVAYSTDDTKALCYYSEIGDGLAGAGYLVFLEKIEGKWMIVESAMQWVA